MSALEAIRIASWCSRSGSKRVDVSSRAAICSASRALIASGLPPGRSLGARGQRGDLVEPRAQHARRAPRPRAGASRQGSASAVAEARDDRGLGGAAILLALILVDHLDHALEAEDAVDRRRRRLDALGDIAHGGQDRGQHRLVDPHDRRDAGALHRQVRMHGAARERFGGARAQRRLDRIPAGRQAQPQLQPLGVDGFQLPGPDIGARHAVGAREAGHARQRHQTNPASERRKSGE